MKTRKNPLVPAARCAPLLLALAAAAGCKARHDGGAASVKADVPAGVEDGVFLNEKDLQSGLYVIKGKTWTPYGEKDADPRPCLMYIQKDGIFIDLQAVNSDSTVCPWHSVRLMCRGQTKAGTVCSADEQVTLSAVVASAKLELSAVKGNAARLVETPEPNSQLPVVDLQLELFTAKNHLSQIPDEPQIKPFPFAMKAGVWVGRWGAQVMRYYIDVYWDYSQYRINVSQIPTTQAMSPNSSTPIASLVNCTRIGMSCPGNSTGQMWMDQLASGKLYFGPAQGQPASEDAVLTLEYVLPP